MLLCHSWHCLPRKVSLFARADPSGLPKASCNHWLDPQEQAWSLQGALGLGHPIKGQVLVSALGRSPPCPRVS